MARISGSLVQMELEDQLRDARLAAAFASAYVAGPRQAVEDLASRWTVIEAVLADVPEATTNDLRTSLRVHPQLGSTVLFDLNGVTRAVGIDNPEVIGIVVSDRDYFREALQTGQASLGRPVIGRGTGQPSIPYAVPVVDGGGAMRAIVLGGISIRRLSEALAGLRTESATHISIIDHRDRGVIVADRDLAQVMGAPRLSPEVLDSVLRGDEAIRELEDPGEEPVLLACAPVSGLPWSVIVRRPRAVVLSPVTRRGWDEVLVAGAVIAVSAAVGAVAATWVVSPISHLRRVVSEVAAGNLSRRVGTTRRDEIGELGRAFDAMAQRVRVASQRMGDLVDAMTAFIRLGGHPLRRETVDVSALARSAVATLQRREPGRAVRFSIADGVSARGDRALLRVVLDNLLDNAWKFTAPTPRAEIAFGSAPVDGRTAYYVRDNGVGFDMAHAAQLFGLFQRLHAPGEFEGMGIGLAIARRIVHRHGGRMWAESAVGEGATFWFTLGNGAHDA